MAKKEKKTETSERTPLRVPEKMVAYSMETANKVLEYLGTRPYQEVAGLVTAMQSGKMVEPEDDST